MPRHRSAVHWFSLEQLGCQEKHFVYSIRATLVVGFILTVARFSDGTLPAIQSRVRESPLSGL
jgi:hypothetical protein